MTKQHNKSMSYCDDKFCCCCYFQFLFQWTWLVFHSYSTVRWNLPCSVEVWDFQRCKFLQAESSSFTSPNKQHHSTGRNPTGWAGWIEINTPLSETWLNLSYDQEEWFKPVSFQTNERWKLRFAFLCGDDSSQRQTWCASHTAYIHETRNIWHRNTSKQHFSYSSNSNAHCSYTTDHCPQLLIT